MTTYVMRKPASYTPTKAAQEFPDLSIDGKDSRECPCCGSLVSLLDTTQCAARLGITETHLRKLRSNGEGPPFIRLSARTVRYRSDWIAAYVQAITAGRLDLNTATPNPEDL